MKAEEFDEYMMNKRRHRWSDEAFIPLVLRSIFRSIDENKSRSVPISLIAKDFREFYSGNEERKKKSLRKNKKENTEYVLMNIETVDETELIQLLFERPFGTLGKRNPGRKNYHEFIEYEEENNPKFINVNQEIFDAYAERSEDWKKVIDDYFKNY